MQLVRSIFLFATLFAASQLFAQGWTTKASLTYQRDNVAVVSLNGIVYAIGGAPAGVSVLSSVEAYDPAADAWTTRSSMSVPRYGASAAAVNGVIYAIGGTSAVDGSIPISSIEVYDPGTDNWSQNVPGTNQPLASLPTGRWGLHTAVVDGIIYAIGGSITNNTNVSNVLLTSSSVAGNSYSIGFDTALGKIKAKSVVVKAGGVTKTLGSDYTYDSTNGSIAVVSGGSIADGSAVTVDYVYSNSIYYGTVEAYDPQTNQWTEKSPMPTPRYGMTTAVVNGLIYAIGGWGGWPELSVVEIYDPQTDSWSTTVPGTNTPLSPMPTPRDDFGYGVLNGAIYAMGGDINGVGVPAGTVNGVSFNGTCCTAVMEAYDTAGNTWASKPAMPTTRDDFGSAVVGGTIYAVAGSLDGPPSAPTYGGVSYTTLEAYTPSDIPVPGNVSAFISSGQATISWSPVAGAVSYNIYWSNKQGVSTASGTKIAGVTSPYADSLPGDGAWRYYVVTAATANGESFPSDEVSVHKIGFSVQTGVPLGSTITSNSIRIVDPGSAGTISIQGGEYAINGGQYTSASGSVSLGDTVTVQVASSSSNATSSSAALTINGISSAFSVTTLKSNQTISFGPSPALSFGAAGAISATSTSGLVVTFGTSTPSICSVSGNTVAGLAAGTCTVTANQAGNAEYNVAAEATLSIPVAQASQGIGPVTLSPLTLSVGGTSTLSATSTSNLALTFGTGTPSICSVSGNTVTGLAAGTCTVTADQPGNADYAAAVQVEFGFSVGPKPVDGSCGTSNGQNFPFAPSSNLCATGTAGAVTGSGPWNWSCSGSSGGASISCSAGISKAVNLVPGWNLVGNGMSDAIDVAAEFGNASYVVSVWKWETSGSNANVAYPAWAFYSPLMADGGQAYAASKGYDFLTAIKSGEGFWVNAASAFSVTVSGTPVATSYFQDQAPDRLPSGWSLIAVGDSPTPEGFDIGIGVAQSSGTIPANVVSIWAWGAGKEGWYFYAPSLDSEGLLENYISAKHYLDFGTMTLDAATGFWVNHP